MLLEWKHRLTVKIIWLLRQSFSYTIILYNVRRVKLPLLFAFLCSVVVFESGCRLREERASEEDTEFSELKSNMRRSRQTRTQTRCRWTHRKLEILKPSWGNTWDHEDTVQIQAQTSLQLTNKGTVHQFLKLAIYHNVHPIAAAC